MLARLFGLLGHVSVGSVYAGWVGPVWPEVVGLGWAWFCLPELGPAGVGSDGLVSVK